MCKPMSVLGIIGTLAALLACGCGTRQTGTGFAPVVAGTACTAPGAAVCTAVGANGAVVVCISGLWQVAQVCAADGYCAGSGSTASCVGGADAATTAETAATPDSATPPDTAAPVDTASKPDAVTTLDSTADSSCTSASQCDDGNPCTQDKCLYGSCSSASVDGPNPNCSDGDPCTVDGCYSGTCKSFKDVQLCAADAQDGDTSKPADTLQPPDAVATDASDGTGDTAGDAKADALKQDIPTETAPVGDIDGTIVGATEMTVDVPSGALVGQDTLDPTGDVDYWTFTGKKGQLIEILVQSNQQNSPFDPLTIDSMVTLYGPNQQQIAFNNDDPSLNTSDSELVTVLPTDGTYYLRVEECFTWAKAHPTAGANCGGTADKDNVDYLIVVFELNPAEQTNISPEAGEPNDGVPTPAGYQLGTYNYLTTVMYGALSSATDVDKFAFTPPPDSNVTSGRPTCHFNVGPPGIDGNGSTLDGLMASIRSQASPGVVLAQVDLMKGEISFPCTLGQAYVLTLERTATSTVGSADFYVVSHFVGGSNPLEKAESANNTAAGAEALASQPNSQGLPSYYVSGDLINGAQDVDYFSVTVPAGAVKGSVYCAAQKSGSGLVGLTAEVKTATDGAIAGGSATEDPAKGLALKGLAIPSGTSKLLLKVSATGQDPVNTGFYYLCGMLLAGP